MALYDKPVRELMKDMGKDLAPDESAVFTRSQAFSWFDKHYPRIKRGTVGAHLVRLSTNARSRLHYSAKPGEDDVFYQVDRSTFRRYKPETDPPPIHESSMAPGEIEYQEEEEAIAAGSEGGGEFAYEADLRNYLAKNLSELEPGLRLFEEEGVTGVEFPVGGRFIDILAIDASDRLVVIELKVSRGYDRVVGQLMRYVAWIERELAEAAQDVRGIIVARQISEDLRLACSLMKNIQLYEYELSLRFRSVAGES